jgi:outer membrane protein insertion porin family
MEPEPDESAKGEPHLGPHRVRKHVPLRDRPMGGCLRAIFFFGGGGLLLIALLVSSGWWYLGTSSFAELVRLRVAKTLESKLGRTVTIGSVEIVRSRPQKIILRDLRIGNAPGGVAPYFATVKEVDVVGGVESLWGRTVRVGRIDVIEPRIFFEVYPAGSKLVHNFPHWQPAEKSRYEIAHIDLNEMFITGGLFDFLDRQHQIHVALSNMASQIKVTTAKDLYQGVVTGPVSVGIQDYLPFGLDLRGGFRYTPGVLALQSISLRGQGIEAFVSGKLDPLTDGVYDLRVTSKVGLQRVRQIFKVDKVLDGEVSLDTNLRGKQGDFSLTGGFFSPRIKADVYELAAVRGKLNVTGEKSIIDIQTASYGGGTIGAHYALANYSEPYPMSVDLHYDRVSLEKLFNDWGVQDTGLRGGATGDLKYHWEKDRVLEGAGTGTAKLTRNTTAFSQARYPIPLGGAADFTLDKGTIAFKRGALDTESNHIDFSGTVRIDNLFTDLKLAIDSRDFSELDRAAFNFARSAGKNSYELLGLAGAGKIDGTVHGKLKTPQVVAHVAGSGTKYNNILLGDSDIDLRYDGAKSILTFERSTFGDGNSQMALSGTVTFPDSGPSPLFDLALDAKDYPVERALSIVDLKLAMKGNGTGKLVVSGSPEKGKVTFAGLQIRQRNALLNLRGDVAWLPGKGNIAFDLDIGANDFPVVDIVKFFELGEVPVTGDLTGTLHLQGPKDKLEGAGSVTVRKGLAYGEPVDLVSAELIFTTGKVKATNVKVVAPAGTITGEGELDLTTNQFSYIINESTIDLTKLKLFSQLASLFGGRLTITSTGAGTPEAPEVMLQATLNEGTFHGAPLPAGVPPPTLYVAIHNGRLVIRGSAFNALSIEGDGTIAPDATVDGLVQVKILDIAALLNIFSSSAALPATGNAVIDLRLGGKLSSLETLTLDGTVPVLDLKVSEHEFTPDGPLHFALRGGKLEFDHFSLRRADSAFSVAGYVDLLHDQKIQLDVKGEVEAALAQLFVSDLRADGHIKVALGITGTMKAPLLNGTAEFQDAQLKFAGFPQLIDHLTGTLVFKGDRIDIDALRATVGGGTVTAGGFITLNGMTPARERITLQGTGVSLRLFEGVSVDGDFTLLLTGDTERVVLQGDVNVNQGLYFKDFDLSTSVLNLILSRRGVTPTVAASWQDRVSLRIHMTAPGTLAVKNNIADVTGTADLDVSGTLANPVLLGLVTIDEGGKLRFQNTDYKVVRGSINFQNPFRIDPYFDITVEGRVSSNLADPENAGQYDVTVNITGTLDRITPSVTSDPPASDVTLLSILGIGAFSGATRSQAALGSDSFGATGRSLLQQSIFGLIGSKILPFADSFSYDTGALDSSTGGASKVTIEKRISSKVRAIVVYYVGGRDAKNREIIEWQVTPEWVVQLTRDSDNKSFLINAVDVRFRRRYEGHWTLGLHGLRDTLGIKTETAPLATTAVVATASTTAPAAPTPAAPAPVNSSTSAANAKVDGQPVKLISVRTDSPFNMEHLHTLIALKPNEPLTIRGVQSSIKSLFATGDFRDIRADVEPVPGGVAITFILSLNYRVGDINFEGLSVRERAQVDRDVVFHRGDVFSLNAVDRSAVAVQAVLAKRGYLESTVDPETKFNRARNRADVILHVTKGDQAKIAEVAIDGKTEPFDAATLIKEMKRKTGDKFDADVARAEVERIRRFLVRKDYRKADVKYVGHTYDAASKSTKLSYHVETGPIVKVEVAGVPRGDVKRVIPFGKNQPYSADVIDRASDNIVSTYQKRGYFRAAVDTEEKLTNGVWVITYHVNPGQKLHLQTVDFAGNQKLSNKELSKVITTSPSGGFSSFLGTLLRRPGGVTQKQLGADRDALESYYRVHGFSEVTIGTPVAKEAADGAMTVTFPITEGAQTLVTAVKVEGNEQVSGGGLPKLALKPGDPLNPQIVRDDLVTLQTFYGERGNSEVQVTPRFENTTDKTGSAVTYVVAEGPRVVLDEVIVRGNTYTDQDVVLTKAGLKKGDPFSYRSILEAQRDLYRLGIFKRVEVQPQQAGTTVGQRDVVIQVEEGKDLSVAGSVGISSGVETSKRQLGVRGAVSIAHRNLFGSGRYLGLELIGGQEQQAFLTYREPFIFGQDIPVQLSLFRTDDRTRQDARIRQWGSSIELSRIAGLQTRWSLRYEYKISECIAGAFCDSATGDLPIEGVPREQQKTNISSITPTFFWDRRDDALDPHRGFLTTASVQYAFPIFRAKTSFLKEFVQGAWYLPVSRRSVFAVSGRLGLIQAFKTDRPDPLMVLADGTLVSTVPFSERFTAGGESTNRGYTLNNLGILPEDCLGIVHCSPTLVPDPNQPGRTDKFIAIGGNALALINMEYRFPIIGSFGGAVFTDGGNVWRNSGDIQFNQFRWSIGTGFRYLTPVGPARIDVGYKLRDVPYEGRFAFFFTLGHAF